MGLHAGEEFLAQVPIDPADVEVEAADWIEDEVPLEFLGDMLDDGILGL